MEIVPETTGLLLLTHGRKVIEGWPASCGKTIEIKKKRKKKKLSACQLLSEIKLVCNNVQKGGRKKKTQKKTNHKDSSYLST